MAVRTADDRFCIEAQSVQAGRTVSDTVKFCERYRICEMWSVDEVSMAKYVLRGSAMNAMSILERLDKAHGAGMAIR